MPNIKKLYYLSDTPVELLIPTVPKTLTENFIAPRVCLGDSIQGRLLDLSKNVDLAGKQYKVYVIETDKYSRPTLSEIPSRDLTGEYWVPEAIEPEYLYDIQVDLPKGHKLEEISGEHVFVPQWSYTILESERLNEDTRTLLVSKSRSTGPYKNQMRGKNRFERKKHSKIAKTVKQYNKIDMNKLFKEDILEVAIPVMGETDNYTVSIRMEGVVAEIAKNIKNNKNKLEYRTIVQALTKVFNTSNIFVKCTCPDYKYRFAHWNIVNKVSIDDSSKDPGPGKGIRNPNDQLGRGCKHVLLVLANGDWVMKVASVINNYIHYAEKKLQKPFLKLIFPKLYGIPADEMIEQDLIDDDKYLDSSEGLIDAINDYGRRRGQYAPGTNKNPVTGTGGKQKASTTPSKETEPEAKKTAPGTAPKAPEQAKASDKPEQKLEKPTAPAKETDKKSSEESEEDSEES
jgi:hypothetical protein